MLLEVKRGPKKQEITVTETSRKYGKSFSKNITPWSSQDSNPGPSALDPDASITAPITLI